MQHFVSHYYVDPLIQQITEETNGFIGDSLEMAKFGSKCQTEKPYSLWS